MRVHQVLYLRPFAPAARWNSVRNWTVILSQKGNKKEMWNLTATEMYVSGPVGPCTYSCVLLKLHIYFFDIPCSWMTDHCRTHNLTEVPLHHPGKQIRLTLWICLYICLFMIDICIAIIRASHNAYLILICLHLFDSFFERTWVQVHNILV